MKMKSIVFTVALASAASAFSDPVTGAWFATNATVNFDKALNDPVVITNTVVPATAVAGYAITAYVTNLVVFASQPSSSTPGTFDGKALRGSICAADGKWYGWCNTGWTELTAQNSPIEGTDYKLRMEFNSSPSTVKYIVSTIADDAAVVTSSSLTTADGVATVPTRWAFAGMGGCTNIVGEVFIDIPEGSTSVTVNTGSADEGRIIIDTKKLNAVDVDRSADNGLKYWVNYVLGVGSGNGTAGSNEKPFAAPAQNDDPSKLTFNLGGVHVLGQDETGAKVTYTVEKRNSLSADWETAVNNEYKSDDANFDVAVPDSVQYYRIKIKIDPAH